MKFIEKLRTKSAVKAIMDNDKNKQHKRIAEYITDNHSITGAEAHEHLGVESFTKRISEMRQIGYPLVSKWETGRNRYGELVRYKRWYFE